MKRIFFLFFLLFGMITFVQAQQNQKFLTDIKMSVYSSSFAKDKVKFQNFIKENNGVVIRLEEEISEVFAEFYISKDKIEKFDELIKELGYVKNKKISTENYDESISKLNKRISYLKSRKKSYEDELKSMNSKDERYYSFWNEVRNIEEELYKKENELSALESETGYKIIINLYDDKVDLTERGVKWVNMPGAAFGMLFIETPKVNLSAEQYMGYSLKYMITRGKTYFSLGTLKKFSNEETGNDTLMFTEFFHFGIGQDFYTKYFGRGKRKWFNLYTGFNAGGMFATSNSENKMLFTYVKAFLGLEIFKNKYFLIDNKAGYFVPFKENRNLRGITYNFSINFVF